MRGSSVLPFAVGLCAGYAVFSIAALHREAATREVVAEAARAAAAAERAASASAAAASAAERHEKAALGASLRALAAAAGPGPAEEEDDARACGVAVPAAMRYWADAEVPAPAGAVPAYDVEAYLTFVPDFGGWNNVRLSLETALVLARASGRVLVLPPVQSYYLLTACKAAEGGCEYSLADFAPPLLAARSRARVISSEEFFAQVLPRLAAEGRLADDVEWPPRKKVTNAAARCTPRHKATDSCFPLYEWLDASFVADFVPDTEGGVVIFGKARAQRVFGDDFTEARVAKLRYDPPEWRRDGLARLWREPVDGDKELRDNRRARAVVHLRTAGWKTHGADAKHVDRAGRLLTPFYA